MDNVKRFDIFCDWSRNLETVEADDGNWVDFSDFEELLLKYKKLEHTLADMVLEQSKTP